MKFDDKFCEIITRALEGSPHPTVAVIAKPVQAMYSDDYELTIGSGESTYEAVCNALNKTKLRGQMKDWAVGVSCKSPHDNLSKSSIMDRPTMGILRKEGLHVVIYVQKDGSLSYFTP